MQMHVNLDYRQHNWRLGFHLQTAVGWLSDPNGLCQFNGEYHIFHQYAPRWPWAGHGWGHWTSRDLTTWEFHRGAIIPEMELDKKFSVGDTALVVLPPNAAGGDILVARDHWRMGWGFAFFAGFCILLCVFGGWTGLKALFSFVFSCLVVWKLLIPLVLAGWHASTVVFAAVAVLTGVIMYLVAGWTRKGISAFAGAMLGVVASLALAHFFGRVMNVNGATMPFAQQLLYSGFSGLDLQDIFFGAIVLASSGAVMDLAMDISAGVSEVARHSPGLGRRELFMSGIRIGRAVVGTMTTTLLLAYSGGYLTLLMVFAAQGTSPVDFINSTLVSAEFVKTMVGSFGLVLVAPASALVAAYLHDNG